MAPPLAVPPRLPVTIIGNPEPFFRAVSQAAEKSKANARAIARFAETAERAFPAEARIALSRQFAALAKGVRPWPK